MKKEPKFRGKSIETNEWVYGCGWYHIDYTEEYKKENNMSERANLLTKSGFVECYLESMGQFTGLKDENGVDIVEGDIIKIPDDYDTFGLNAGETYEVYFGFGGFRMKAKYTNNKGHWLEDDNEYEIIGDIYNNPELIE